MVLQSVTEQKYNFKEITKIKSILDKLVKEGYTIIRDTATQLVVKNKQNSISFNIINNKFICYDYKDNYGNPLGQTFYLCEIKDDTKNKVTKFSELYKFCSNRQSTILMDKDTILLKIDSKNCIYFNRNLSSNYVDIGIKSGTKSINKFMKLSVKIAYDIICQYK